MRGSCRDRSQCRKCAHLAGSGTVSQSSALQENYTRNQALDAEPVVCFYEYRGRQIHWPQRGSFQVKIRLWIHMSMRWLTSGWGPRTEERLEPFSKQPLLWKRHPRGLAAVKKSDRGANGDGGKGHLAHCRQSVCTCYRQWHCLWRGQGNVPPRLTSARQSAMTGGKEKKSNSGSPQHAWHAVSPRAWVTAWQMQVYEWWISRHRLQYKNMSLTAQESFVETVQFCSGWCHNWHTERGNDWGCRTIYLTVNNRPNNNNNNKTTTINSKSTTLNWYPWIFWPFTAWSPNTTEIG